LIILRPVNGISGRKLATHRFWEHDHAQYCQTKARRLVSDWGPLRVFAGRIYAGPAVTSRGDAWTRWLCAGDRIARLERRRRLLPRLFDRSAARRGPQHL